MTENQKFTVADEYLSVPEIFERYQGQLRSLNGFAQGVRAVAMDAIQHRDQYTKVDQEVRLVLVVGLTEKRDNDKGYHLLITNQREWTARHITRLFSYRPKIEQIHRQGKQRAGWGAFHTRSLTALTCHLAIAMLRNTLLAILQCVPALRAFSLEKLIQHGVQMPARLLIQPAEGHLRVQVPDTPLSRALQSLLKIDLNSLLVKVLAFP